MATDSKSEKAKVLITGGNGGLAVACRKQFENLGWTVQAPTHSELNVLESASVEAYVKHAGDIDLLVCAAGSIDDELLFKLSEPQWDKLLNEHLSGAFRCARAVSRGMLKRRCGHVIFIGSYSGFHPPAGQAHYAAAKAGLKGLMHSLAREWGARDVRSNLIVPGFMQTKMTAQLSDSVIDSVRDLHLLGRFNDPDKVAKFIAFVHQEMTATSGQVFNLDSRIL